MKPIYKSFVALFCAVAFSTAAFAGQQVVKTMPLGDGISTTGIVRIVVKVTDQHVGRDLGIVLHEEATLPIVTPVASWWDYGIGLMMFENVSGTVANSSQLRGYDGTGTGIFNIVNIKNIEKGTTIALWFSIDITGKTHALSYQLSTETAPTQLYSNYISRSSLKLKPSNIAKYCTVFVNDLAALAINGTGANTTASINVISDAVIVPSIEALTVFPTGLISTNATDNKLTVYPTLATDFIKVSADEEISSLKIFSLEGKMVLEGKFSNKMDVTALKSGSYIIEAKTISNNLLRKTFLKKYFLG